MINAFDYRSLPEKDLDEVQKLHNTPRTVNNESCLRSGLSVRVRQNHIIHGPCSNLNASRAFLRPHFRQRGALGVIGRRGLLEFVVDLVQGKESLGYKFRLCERS